jgi:hypothetical protein
MSYGTENKKLSLVECKKILNTNEIYYTDEEIIKIRDWMYHMAEIAIDSIDKNATTTAQVTAINNREKT